MALSLELALAETSLPPGELGHQDPGLGIEVWGSGCQKELITSPCIQVTGGDFGRAATICEWTRERADEKGGEGGRLQEWGCGPRTRGLKSLACEPLLLACG